jgi:serine/threonine protein kinase
MVEEFRKSILRELDYKQEARNLATLAHNLRDFDRIVVPTAIDDYTTSRVLTTTYVRGTKITTLSPLVRTELDGSALAEQLFRAYLQQILVDGFVHADPHPGNVFLTEDDRIALLDLGMVAHVSSAMQEKLLQLLLAVSEGKSDEAATVAIRDRPDDTALRRGRVPPQGGRPGGADEGRQRGADRGGEDRPSPLAHVGRVGDPRAVRADDAGQDAPEPGPGRARPRPHLRSQRVHPAQRRRPDPSPACARPCPPATSSPRRWR